MPVTAAWDGCRTRVYRRTSEVPAAEWDSLLSPDDVQATHRFVRTCEESAVADAEYRHLMIHQEGRLAAITVLSRMVVRLDLLATGRPRWLLERVRERMPAFLEVPVVFCGLPVSFGQSLLRVHPRADAAGVLAAVHAAATSFARDTQAPLTCFKEFTRPEADNLTPLAAHGYRRLPSLPSCNLQLPWRTWDSYVNSMRAGYRRQLRATLRAGEQHGLRVTTRDRWTSDARRIFGLYDQVIQRAEFRLERLNAEFFERLSHNLAGDSGVVLVEDDTRLRAAAVLLYGTRASTFLLAGIDYEWSHARTAYQLLLCEVIRHAIERGSEAVELGQTSYAAKQRVGASVGERVLFVRCTGAFLRPLFNASAGVLFPTRLVPARRVFTATP